MRSRTLVITLLLGLSATVAPSVSSVARAADDSVTVIARQRFKEGVALFDKGKFEDARVAFVQAYALKKHPVVLLNLAQSELKSGHPVAAARHFAQFLRENKNVKPSEQKLASDGLKQARQKTARIQLLVDVPFAEVIVDDESVGQTPLPEAVDVKPGENHIVVKTSSDSRSVTVATTVQQVASATVRFKQKAETAQAVGQGGGQAQSSLSVGGDTGTSTQGPGNERESFISWMKHDPVAWGGAGATLLGAGLAVGFAVAHGQADSNANSIAQTIKETSSGDQGLIDYQGSGLDRQQNPCADPVPVTSKGDYRDACSQLKDNLDKRDNDEVLAWVGGGLFVAGAAATTVLYFIRTDPDAQKPASSARRATSRVRASIAPIVSPTVQGLAIGGSF